MGVFCCGYFYKPSCCHPKPPLHFRQRGGSKKRVNDRIHRAIWNMHRGGIGFYELHAGVGCKVGEIFCKAFRISGEGDRADRDVELGSRMEKRFEHPASKKTGGSGEENAFSRQALPKPANLIEHVIEIVSWKGRAHGILFFNVRHFDVLKHGKVPWVKCDKSQPVLIGGSCNKAISESAPVGWAIIARKSSSLFCNVGCDRQGGQNREHFPQLHTFVPVADTLIQLGNIHHGHAGFGYLFFHEEHRFWSPPQIINQHVGIKKPAH